MSVLRAAVVDLSSGIMKFLNSLHDAPSRRFPTGWIIVLALALLTPILHAFIISTSHTGVAAGRALGISSAAPGESCFVPRGAVHGFNNLKQTDVKALAIITPALLGPDFFRQASAIVNADGPPDVEKLKAVLLRHGLAPAMPQGASR